MYQSVFLQCHNDSKDKGLKYHIEYSYVLVMLCVIHVLLFPFVLPSSLFCQFYYSFYSLDYCLLSVFSQCSHPLGYLFTLLSHPLLFQFSSSHLFFHPFCILSSVFLCSICLPVFSSNSCVLQCSFCLVFIPVPFIVSAYSPFIYLVLLTYIVVFILLMSYYS